jgi:hypothetical protein
VKAIDVFESLIGRLMVRDYRFGTFSGLRHSETTQETLA